MRYELAIIVPTLNEKENLVPLLALLDAALTSIAWELIFVDDDSSDGTWQSAWRLAEARSNVRCIRRVGRRGLASACVEGMLATATPYLAVMDGDLQHDEKLLPEMLRHLKSGELDIVVASRFKDDHRPVGLSSSRERMSRLGNWIATRVCKADLTDPLSGFFMMRRGILEEVVYSLSTLGFKILVDIFASSKRRLRFLELPFTFRSRLHGDSKLDTAVIAEFAMLLCDKTVGHVLPTRFVSFLAVGLSGVVLHFAVLGALILACRLPFMTAQGVATGAAMIGNYLLNNELTYRDLRLNGVAFWSGLAGFLLICATGALINFTVAWALFHAGVQWAAAGTAGAFVGGIWNYNITSFFVWRKRFVPAASSDAVGLARETALSDGNAAGAVR